MRSLKLFSVILTFAIATTGCSVLCQFLNCPPTRPILKIDLEKFPGPDGKIGTSDDITPPTGPEIEFHPVLSLSDEYQSVGLVFEHATLFWGPEFGAEASFGSYCLSSIPVEARFTVPVYGIEITSYSCWNAKLTAYDNNDRVLAVTNLWHPNPSTSTFFRGKLNVFTTEPIVRFTVIEQSENSDLILNLDNIVLNLSP